MHNYIKKNKRFVVIMAAISGLALLGDTVAMLKPTSSYPLLTLGALFVWGLVAGSFYWGAYVGRKSRNDRG